MRYVPSLDGLRAYAVAFVLLAHMPVLEGSRVAALWGTLTSGLRLGYLGVDLFFVLSGFLVTSILLADKEAGRFSFGRFYLKRALRLFPVFYLCIAVCALTFGLPTGELLANLFYVSNYYYAFVWDLSPLRHTWSLSVEEQFYIVWPFVIALFARSSLPRILVLGVPALVGVALVLAYAWVPQEYFGRLVTRGVMFRVLSLGAGAVLALYAARLPALKPTWIVLLGATGLAGHVGSVFLDTYARATVGLFSMTLLSVSVFLAVYVGAANGLRLVRVLFESRPVVYVGRISYGIYLYHFIVLYALGGRVEGGHATASAFTIATFLVLSFLIPAISYRFLERPILDVKDRLNVKNQDPARLSS